MILSSVREAVQEKIDGKEENSPHGRAGLVLCS